MVWIGWLIASCLGYVCFKSFDETRKSHRAIASLQSEIAKLAGLWIAEVKKRRALEDEYYKTGESPEAECARRYGEAGERVDLYPVAFDDNPNASMFRSKFEVWYPHLIESDPEGWGKRMVPHVLGFEARRVMPPKP